MLIAVLPQAVTIQDSPLSGPRSGHIRPSSSSHSPEVGKKRVDDLRTRTIQAQRRRAVTSHKSKLLVLMRGGVSICGTSQRMAVPTDDRQIRYSEEMTKLLTLEFTLE